jgi:hypothetical protein
MGDVEMIDVICFCGNSYSFVGDAGACPQCGEPVTFKSAGTQHARGGGEPAAERTSGTIRDERPEDMAA